MRLQHRPKVWSVYVYEGVKPTLGRTVYLGRYRIVAYAIALARYPFTTRTVQVSKR